MAKITIYNLYDVQLAGRFEQTKLFGFIQQEQL